MSIVTLLARQNLIARKNDLQYQMLQNSSSMRRMLNSNVFFGGGLNLADISSRETAMDLENIAASSELMAINAELNSLNDSSSRFNYFA